MSIITNEIPTGTIDGVNKVFNFSENIGQFITLWVDGVIYTGFSFDGTTVTLSDAPTESIFGTYMPWSSYMQPEDILTKETPQGEINGINTIFQTTNIIFKMIHVWIDGVIYTNYKYNPGSRQIILMDAPQESIFVDYFIDDSNQQIYAIPPAYESKVIAKETPDGEINGQNMIFFTKAYFDKILSIWLDGVIYNDYTIGVDDGTGNKQVILEDAPQESLYIDYLATDFNPLTGYDIKKAFSFEEVKKQTWKLLGVNYESAEESNFDTQTMIYATNNVLEALYKGIYPSLLEDRIYRAGNTDFNLDFFTIQITNQGRLTKELKPGDKEAHISGSVLQSGFVEIGGDIISYGQYYKDEDENIILGINGVTSTHGVDSYITQIFILPKNFERLERVDVIGLNNFEKELFDEGYSKYELIYKNGRYYIKFYTLKDNANVKIKFRVKAPIILKNEDYVVLPEGYPINLLTNLIAGELAYQSLLPQAQSLLMIGYKKLQQFWITENEKDKNTVNKIKINHYKHRGRWQ